MVIHSTQNIPSSSTDLPILRSLLIWMRHMLNQYGRNTMQRCVSLIPPRNFGSKKPDAPQEHLRAWLADSLGRDQYVTYRGDEVSIRWHGRPSQCEVAFEDHVRIPPFGLISHSTLPDVAKPTNRIIRLVVTTRYIRRHPPPTGRPTIWRPLLPAPSSLLPPPCPSHRLFAVREISRYLVP
jgi:hypothetical protein